MIEHIQDGCVDLWYSQAGRELDLVFTRDQSASHCQRERADARWAALCARNPRLFDGAISAVTSFDPASLRFTWRASTYKQLAVQDEVDTGTWQLSVTTLLVAGAGDALRVLLGRRSRGVHTYPGLWEFGASGGVDPPAGDIDRAYLLDETRREMREEIGLEHSMAGARIVGVFRDAQVHSYDVLVRMAVDQEPGLAKDDWEYDEAMWVATSELVSMKGLCQPSAVVASRIGSLIRDAHGRGTRATGS